MFLKDHLTRLKLGMTVLRMNLPAEFKRTDVNERVAVRFFDTGQFETMSMLSSMSGPRIVVTLSIHKL